MPKGCFISYLKERKLVSEGCIYHLIRVNNSYVEVPSLQSIPIVSEFLEVFLNDLPGVSPEREINIRIDVIPDICSISIPPYKMALAELKNV